MTELWLVRHGQTDWNREGRFQGSVDIALNENGLGQAREIAERLKEVKFQAIYSSPLQRARQTAQMIAEKNGKKVHFDSRLSEISMGEWEGMLYQDICREYPEEINERRVNPLYARAPGGETAVQVAERMKQAVDEIVLKHPHGPVLIVSHGLALSALVCLVRGGSLENVYNAVLENAAPVVVQWKYDGEGKDD